MSGLRAFRHALGLLAASVLLLAGIWNNPVDAAGCGTLQSRIDQARAGSTLDLTGCTVTGGAILEKSLIIRGGTIRAPAGTWGVLVLASRVTFDGVVVVGTQANRFVPHEVGIYIKGTAASPASYVTVRNSTIQRLGNEGIYLENVAAATVTGNHIRDVVYAGVMVVSGRGGHIDNNVIQRVGIHGSEENSGNAYGISLSRADGPTSTFPLTRDFTVNGNVVEDVPTWHALDAHAAWRITFQKNTVRRASRGIFITADSVGRGSGDVTVSGNYLGAPPAGAVNIAAVTTYNSSNVRITGNTATGWPRDKFFIDYLNRSRELVVSGNSVKP